MDQKMKKIWLEVGLAVALVACLGFLGSRMGDAQQKKDVKIVKAEEENKEAAKKAEAQ